MFLQKIGFGVFNILIAFSVAQAQSTAKVSLNDFGSLAYQIGLSPPIVGNSSEVLQARPFTTPVRISPETQKPGSVAGAYMVGILGGVVGFVGGALIGLSADDCYKEEGDEFCNFDSGFFAGSAAGAVFLAAGVHIGNGRHGKFEKDLLISVLIGGAGVGAAFATGSRTILFTVPIAQLIGTVFMERKETPAE